MVMVHDLSWKNNAAPVPTDRVGHGLARALNWGGQQLDAPMVNINGRNLPRWDSRGSQVSMSEEGMLDAWARKCDGDIVEEMGGMRPEHIRYFQRVQRQRMQQHAQLAAEQGRRFDAQSFISGGVGGFPRDFEFIRQKVWEEALQPLTALTLFAQDTSVPIGARAHTARRELGAGTAAIHRGGSEIPQATIGFVEKQFGVVYIVCAVGTNYFETLTTDFANIQAYEKKLKRARRLVEERMNDVFWFGDIASQVFGVVRYPSLPKKRLVLDYDGNTANFQQQIIQLQALGNEPGVISGTRFSPNRAATSPKWLNYLSIRKHEQSGGTDTTMLEYYLRTNILGITTIDKAPELSGIGPNGEEGFLYWRDDSDALQLVMIQPPTTLPIFQSGPLDQMTVVYAAIGGVVQGDVGNNVLGYADVILN